MIPSTSINVDLMGSGELENTRTYKLTANKIQGFTDELRALEQAVKKVLSTEKYEYAIYSFDYGIEIEDLIGKDRTYVQIELKRRIKECLLKDERVHNIDGFRYSATNDGMLCEFKVASIYGNITIQQEVNI